MTPEGFQCVDVYAYIAYIYLHTVCGYPVGVFCCIFVCRFLFLYVFYLIICRCLDVVHVVQKWLSKDCLIDKEGKFTNHLLASRWSLSTLEGMECMSDVKMPHCGDRWLGSLIHYLCSMIFRCWRIAICGSRISDMGHWQVYNPQLSIHDQWIL